jgi:hypothetical protein
LETERDAAALEQIEGEVAQLRVIASNSTAVAELLDRVRRQRVREDSGRRALVEGKLTEADQYLTKMQPIPALQTLEGVLVLDLPETRTRARALQELAVAVAKRQLEMLMLEKRPEPGPGQDQLMRLLGRWAPEALRDVLRRVNHVRNEGPRADDLKTEVERIAAEARNSSSAVWTVVSRLDRGVRRLRRRYGDLPASELATLGRARSDLLIAVSPWLRWLYRTRSYVTGAKSLYSAGSVA